MLRDVVTATFLCCFLGCDISKLQSGQQRGWQAVSLASGLLIGWLTVGLVGFCPASWLIVGW